LRTFAAVKCCPFPFCFLLVADCCVAPFRRRRRRSLVHRPDPRSVKPADRWKMDRRPQLQTPPITAAALADRSTPAPPIRCSTWNLHPAEPRRSLVHRPATAAADPADWIRRSPSLALSLPAYIASTAPQTIYNGHTHLSASPRSISLDFDLGTSYLLFYS